MEDKLTKLRQGVTLVSPEQRQVVEKMYMEMMNQWRRRKRMFKDVWSAITENSPKNPNEFKVFSFSGSFMFPSSSTGFFTTFVFVSKGGTWSGVRRGLWCQLAVL